MGEELEQVLREGDRDLAAPEKALGIENPAGPPLLFRGEDCAVCHSTSLHTDRQNVHSPVVFGMCTACHELGGRVSDGTAHGALTSGDGCANCHTTHGSKFSKLLKGDRGSLCLACHTKPQFRPDGSLVAPIGKEVTKTSNPLRLHGAVREGNCVGCHDPHGSRRFLLKDDYTDKIYEEFDPQAFALCFACHEVEAFLRKETKGLKQFRNGTQNPMPCIRSGRPTRSR